MAATNDSESTLTTELDNITEIHAQSGIQTPHQSRRTASGFVVTESRLPGYSPTPPPKVAYRSWIWEHGEPITLRVESLPCWMCTICYNDGVHHPLSSFITKATPTTLPTRHLQRHGFDHDGNKIGSAKRKSRSIQESFERQDIEVKRVFDREGWKDCFIRWQVCSRQSLRQAVSAEHYDLLAFQHPRIEAVIPRSHNTVQSWVIDRLKSAKLDIIRSLSASRSDITLSFDHWKADNDQLDLLGVIAHYLDHSLQRREIVLAMRDTLGSHSGENISEQLLEVIREYQISTKIAYYAADNATNNDKGLRLLSNHLVVNPITQRLRCGGHIINLVCKAILYGVDIDCVEDVLHNDLASYADSTRISSFDNILRTQDEQAKLYAWRKKGPIGKLHIVVLHIKHSAARRVFFESKQYEVSPAARIYRVVLNGGIKWNSTCEMINCGIKLKDALQLYQEHYRNEGSLTADDCLTSEDWHELSELQTLLKPLRECSLNLQSIAHTGTHGALHEVLTTMDHLLTILEAAKHSQTHLPPSHFKASVNLGWKKLNSYYALTDQTPAYRLAVFLHPRYRMRWFDKKWSDKPQWRAECLQVVTMAYEECKKRFCDEVVTPPRRDQSAFDAYNDLDSDEDHDELTQYMQEARAPHNTQPLHWWQANHHRYPILRHLAFTLLAAPSSTASNERLFSMAGDVVNEDRPHTEVELAEATQCLRSWYSQGLI